MSVVTDQMGCPTLASDLAKAAIRLLDVGATGTVHYCNAQPCTWHEFAVEIVRQAGHDAPVARITSDTLELAATRPAYSVLDTTSYTTATGDVSQSWRDALANYFADRGSTRRAAIDNATDSIRSAP